MDRRGSQPCRGCTGVPTGAVIVGGVQITIWECFPNSSSTLSGAIAGRDSCFIVASSRSGVLRLGTSGLGGCGEASPRARRCVQVPVTIRFGICPRVVLLLLVVKELAESL